MSELGEAGKDALNPSAVIFREKMRLGERTDVTSVIGLSNSVLATGKFLVKRHAYSNHELEYSNVTQGIAVPRRAAHERASGILGRDAPCAAASRGAVTHGRPV